MRARLLAVTAALFVASLAYAHADLDLGARLSVPAFVRAGTTEHVEAYIDVRAFDPASGTILTVDTDTGTFVNASMASPWRCTREAKRVRCAADEAAAGPHTLLLDVATPATGTMNVTASVESLFSGDPVVSNNTARVTSRVYVPSACSAAPPALVSGTTSEGLTELVWSPVAGAIGYEVFAGLDGETPHRVATTSDAARATTRFPGGGDVSWFVRANFAGCPSVESERTTFASAGVAPRLAVSTIASPLFTEPVGVALDGNYVLVADAGQRKLRQVFMPTGSVFDEPMIGEVDTPPLRFDGGIAVGPGRYLYVADRSNHLVRYTFPIPRAIYGAVGLANTPGSSDGLGKAARLRAPLGVVSDASSHVFIADSGNSIIRRMVFDAPKGEFTTTTFVGASAGLNEPAGLAVDADGNLYVADRGNHVIRRVTPAGQLSTLAGVLGQPGHRDGNAAQALFNQPLGIGVDPWGNVLVSEEGNHTIRKIAPNGRVTTVAGTPGIPGNSDGIGASAAFNRPAFLAIDANGVIWIADRANGTLRRASFAIPGPKRRAARK